MMKRANILAVAVALSAATPAWASVRITGDFPQASFDVTLDDFIASGSAYRMNRGEVPFTNKSSNTITYISLSSIREGEDTVQIVYMEPGTTSRVFSYLLPKGSLSKAGTGLVATQEYRPTSTGTITLQDLSAPATQPAPAPVVSAVPEPAAWAMLLAGFACVGTMLRYRRRRVDVRVA